MLCSALVGEVKIDINPMNVEILQVLLNQNKLSHGNSLPDVAAEIEEGVVLLTLVSPEPEVSKMTIILSIQHY